MSIIKTTHNRRSFLKISAAGGGGMLLGFSWIAGCVSPTEEVAKAIPAEWFDINAFLKIGDTGLVTIMSPNPEIGQNVKTSMPMIVAEELDVAWRDVVVEQAALGEQFTRQVAGGSQSIRQGWDSLRMAGATARQMLMKAAANRWNIDLKDCTSENGIVSNTKNTETLSYGELAAEAAKLEVPEEVPLKEVKDFKIIGKDTENVDMDAIISGQPLFGLDTKREGMQYACVLRPPAFGQTLIGFDDSVAKGVEGVQEVVKFGDKVAVLANSTWAAMQGKKALKANWKDNKPENTAQHNEKMRALLDKKNKEPKRNDGNVKKAFADADEVIERTYEAPFLPHNCMEPMNFFAHVTDEKVELHGPVQTPAWTKSKIAKILDRKEEDISVSLTRMGGGFGRRLYGDFAEEAAELSQLSKKPVQVVFSREDDMTAGTYRPASKYKFRLSLKDGKVTGYHLTEAFINGGMWDPIAQNFPAACIENVLVESNQLESNITTGAWRAPVTNFLAFAEQAFFDEVAQYLGKDAVQLRLDLLARAKENPVGKLEYEPEKLEGVIKLAAEKSGWNNKATGTHLGFSAYYSHNTYVAEVAEVVMENNQPKVKKVICAVDCGIVVNPIAAKNQIEGGIIDGIGHAMYGDISFENGKPSHSNFHQYRMIRMSEAPAIDVHFVKSENKPTGLGEPTLPPAGGAVANAIHAATGKRMYNQPFVKQVDVLG